MATYEAVATRSGGWWAIEVMKGLPRNVLGVSQARRRGELDAVTRDLIVDLLDADPLEIELDVFIESRP